MNETQSTANTGKQPNRISACLVVYNEEQVIGRCLDSLEGVVDEIIVVHDGECRDQTLEIAKRYGARVFVREHSGSCEKHRVFSYETAQGDWILQIDADEYLSASLRVQMHALVEDPTTDAYAFRWPYTNGTKVLKGFEHETKTALFRKSQLYFVAVTHQPPLSYGRTETRLDLTLEHWPTYNNFTFERLKSKHLPWNKIQAREIVHIWELPTFNIPDRAANPLFVYYAAQQAHPLWFALKRYIIFDLIKKLLRRNVWYVFVINWRPTLFFYISALYTSVMIAQFETELGPSFVAPGVSSID